MHNACGLADVHLHSILITLQARQVLDAAGGQLHHAPHPTHQKHHHQLIAPLLLKFLCLLFIGGEETVTIRGWNWDEWVGTGLGVVTHLRTTKLVVTHFLGSNRLDGFAHFLGCNTLESHTIGCHPLFGNNKIEDPPDDLSHFFGSNPL